MTQPGSSPPAAPVKAGHEPPAVGIDLGTTCSVVAFLDEQHHPRTLANAEQQMVTPSVVRFDGEGVHVGQVAVDSMATDYANVAECAKRDLGQRFFPKQLAGRTFHPEELEAYVLYKLKHDASQQLGPLKKVVITVPAYFDEVRRKATQDAGYMAGLDVIDIINEPTAAAIAFGFHHQHLAGDERRKIVVYDLGGGTFDVTVMEIGDRRFATLATDGDMHLGGRDWDQRLVDFVCEVFIRKYGLDPREDPNSEGRLWTACERAKKELTDRESTTISGHFKGQDVELEVTRDEFHDMTRDLLDRTAFTTRQTLEAAGLDWSDVDRVLVVGGSSRMPAVRDLLSELTGMTPDTSVSPEEAVAHGAALHAGYLLGEFGGNEPGFMIHNVNSHSLGIVGVDPRSGKPRTAFLIPRNTRLPAQAKRTFRTSKQGQQSVLVQIVEGENASPDHCTTIGRCSLKELPENLPAGAPIDVFFRYRPDGRLTVQVAVAGSGETVRQDIRRENSMSGEELMKKRKEVARLYRAD